MPSFKQMRPLEGEELEQAYQALIDELHKEVFGSTVKGVVKLRDEWQLATGAMTLEEMEKVNAIFRKHEMTYIMGNGGAPHYWPCLRIHCMKKKEATLHYK